MTGGPTPVFLFSLPRSGSTWVQRVLSRHPEVASVAEPWFLLPAVSALRPQAAVADYSHATLHEAVEDLCAALPAGQRDYYDAIAAMAATLYGRLAGERRYFIDKTPRYHLIADAIAEIFPDARLLFLWRNPLATVGSRIHSYGGVWRGYNWHIDLYAGLDSLVHCYRRLDGRARAVQFEALVDAPDTGFATLFEWLGLDFDGRFLDDLQQVQFAGRLGDQTGAREYQGVSRAPLSKWQRTMASPIRKAWCRRYLRWIGRERLETMGYDYDALATQVREIPFGLRTLTSDAVRFPYSAWRVRSNRRRFGFPPLPP